MQANLSNINIYLKAFSALSPKEIWGMYRVRQLVFIIEQNCLYNDIDEIDLKSTHLLLIANNQVIGTARIYINELQNSTVHIGRVAILKQYRRYALGHKIMNECLTHIHTLYADKTIEISAQCYLDSFYQSHGFKPIGKTYLEDGIPHIKMVIKE